MSTKAQITTAIDTKIRNKTPLVVKIEHADVEQLITDEMFPASVKVEWNGTTSIDPTTDIICSGSLSVADKIKFTVYFWKQGNTVYFNGILESLSGSFSLNALLLIEFDTDLYKPLVTSKAKVVIISANQQVGKQIVSAQDTGVFITSGLPAQVSENHLTWIFNGNYKVAN